MPSSPSASSACAGVGLIADARACRGRLPQLALKPSDMEDLYLSSEHVALRARRPENVAVLQAQLYDDIATRALADTRAWQPIPRDSAHSPYAVTTSNDAAFFSVVDAQGDLAGEALLCGIDPHNRLANLGLDAPAGLPPPRMDLGAAARALPF